MSFSSERFGTSRVPLNFTPLPEVAVNSREKEDLSVSIAQQINVLTTTSVLSPVMSSIFFSCQW